VRRRPWAFWSQAEFGQSGVGNGMSDECPMELAAGLRPSDRRCRRFGDATIRSRRVLGFRCRNTGPPIAVVVAFACKTDSDPASSEILNFLHQSMIEFALPPES